MNGKMSGESVTLLRNEVKALEHFGRKHLEERVESRLVALDTSPEAQAEKEAWIEKRESELRAKYVREFYL